MISNGQLGRAVLELVADNSAFDADLNQTEQRVAKLSDAFKAAGGAAALTEKQQAKVNASVTEAISRYTRLGDTAPKAMLDLEKATRSVEQRTDSLKQAGVGMTAAFTVPLLALGALSMKAASDFEGAVFAIRSGTGATGEALTKLTGSYEKVFADVPDAALKVGEALASLSSRTGLTGTALEDLTIQELNFARIAKTDVQPLIAATTRMFGDWSISTDKQSGSLDYLFRTTQRTGASVQQLTETVVQFGAPLRALGFDFEHGVALIAKWEKEGVNLETVLAGLKMALSKFAAAGKDPQTALQGVIEKIKNAKTEAEGMSIAFSAFGKRAAVDMNRAIIEGRFNIEQLVTSLKEGKDTINEAEWATMGLEEKMTMLKHSLDAALVPIGKVLLDALKSALPHLKGAAENVKWMVEGFGNLPGPVQTATFALAGLLAVVGPLAVGLSKLIVALELIAASRAYTLLAGAIGAAGAIGTAGALAGGYVTNKALGAAMGGQSVSDLKGNIAAVLGRSGGILDQTHGAPLRFDESVNVVGSLPKPPKPPGSGGGTDETKAAIAARKKAIEELAHANDVLTATQQAQILSDQALGLSESQIADILKLHDSTVKHFIETVKERKKAEDEQQKDSVAWNEAYIESVAHIHDSQTKYLRELAADRVKAAESIKNARDKTNLDQLTAVNHFADELEKSSMSTTNYQILQNTRAHDSAIRDLQGVTNLSKQEYDRRKKIIDDYFGHEGKLITDSHKDWVDALSGLGNSFRLLAQTAGEGGLGSVAQALANIVGGMELATKGGIDFKKALDTKDTEAKVMGVAGAVLQMAAAMSQATNTTNKLQAALGGAATGYAAGIGMGLSKISSGIIGAMLAIKSYFDAYEAQGEQALQTAESIRNAWGLITTDIAAAPGGGAIQGLVLTGPTVGPGAQDLIEKLTRAGSAWADKIAGLQEQINLGTISLDDYKFAVAQINAELDKFQKQLDGVGIAIQGVNARTAAFQSPFQKSLDDIAELKKQIADAATGTDTSDLEAQLKQKSDALKDWGAHSQGEFDKLSVYIAGALGAGIAKGIAPMELMKQLKPAFDTLKTGTGEMGLSSTPMAEKMLGVQATIDTSPQAFEKLAAVQQMWTGFNQANMMTKDLVDTMATDVTAQFQTISANGGDMATAMALNQPVLQQMWEAQQKFGMYTDEGTVALLNQAETAGLVGEDQKTVDQQILDVLTEIRNIFGGPTGVTAGATGFASALEEAKAKAKGLHDEVAKVPTTLDFKVTRTIYDKSGDPGGDPTTDRPKENKMHLGGIVSKMHQGGVLWPGGAAIARAHSGMLVGPSALAANEVPLIGQVGEVMLSRNVGVPNAAAMVDMLNRGRLSSDDGGARAAAAAPVTVHYYEIKAIDSQDVQRMFERNGVRGLTEAVRVDAGHQNDYLRKVLKQLVKD
jgi:TP901 family phage tail tape measure protein